MSLLDYTGLLPKLCPDLLMTCTYFKIKINSFKEIIESFENRWPGCLARVRHLQFGQCFVFQDILAIMDFSEFRGDLIKILVPQLNN